MSEPATIFSAMHIFDNVDSHKNIGIQFDPRQAKLWLSEAGYPDGQRLPVIDLFYHSSEFHTRIAQAFQACVKHHLNIEIRLHQMEISKFMKHTAQPNTPHIFLTQWYADYPDPRNWLMELFHPTNSANKTGWDNKKFAELIDKAQTTYNVKDSQLFYETAENILCNKEAVVIPILFEKANYLKNPRLKGWYHMAIGGQHVRDWHLSN